MTCQTSLSSWFSFQMPYAVPSSTGGHEIWWTVDADSEDDALRLLPYYVAERTTITGVSEVQIP